MRICIFGAASAHIDDKYIKAVEELGERLAQRGHSLVFGCGGSGLMGAAARGFKRGGGHVKGVVPTFFKDEGVELLFEECDETVYTQTMAERKAIMEDSAEAFIIVPGGVGTFEEMFQVITLKQLNRFDKAIVIYDVEGYYDTLEQFLDHCCEEKFIASYCKERVYKFTEDMDEVIDYVESYRPSGVPIRKSKLGD
ncbi:MAG: TIGR00730 family Rossman fold protein [Candidatus Coproplasma sp.]